MKEYTKDQITLWGNLNMMAGVITITAVHFIMLLLGFAPLDLLWQGILLAILVFVGSISYKQYQQTKETEE